MNKDVSTNRKEDVEEKERFYVVARWVGEKFYVVELDGTHTDWVESSTRFYTRGWAEAVKDIAITELEKLKRFRDTRLNEEGGAGWEYEVKICELDKEDEEEYN